MPEISLLEHVARECGTLVKRMSDQNISAQNKDETFGAHFVTGADTASQELGLTILKAHAPGEVVIAEEQENLHIIPADCTVFDPLDGTVDYFNHAREYGVTLCTLRDGQPELGVMFWPEDNVLISAVRGHGCWKGGYKNGERVTIPSWHGQRDKILVATDVGPWTDHTVLYYAQLRNSTTW
jgi:histidinol-phosphatase